VALLLLLAGGPPDAGTLTARFHVIANFLALPPKALIMERVSTIIAVTRQNA
jgi:hypothetical protein